ncbi:MAG: hypothetical protein IH892_13200 [Planctomycetes bacterium]|nr:hypothetical protein [Planctomycetota bacterium]
MNTKPFLTLIQFLVSVLACVSAAMRVEPPRIDCVVPLPEQPQAQSSATIWYDDFDGQPKPYAEGDSPLDDGMGFGGKGRSMRCLYEKGKRGIGSRKVFFGDSPTYGDKVVRRGEQFDEVYWRVYVKHQQGWRGAPAKMSRATSLTSSRWSQAMIAHVWSSHKGSLTLDPVCGVQGDRVVTRKYNDFERMKWLGNMPVSAFPIHDTEESGYWVLVECRAKLNTPGEHDGINQLWIDGRLECERRNLDFRGSYTEHGINAVFLEAYWNQGSPVTQSRWYDNFVISTEPIGPVVCPTNPTVIKTLYRCPGRAGAWQVEVAADYDGKEVVYRSQILPPRDTVVIDQMHGTFVGTLADRNELASGRTYYLRVRQENSDGIPSDWSRWHQGFRVAE